MSEERAQARSLPSSIFKFRAFQFLPSLTFPYTTVPIFQNRILTINHRLGKHSSRTVDASTDMAPGKNTVTFPRQAVTA